MCKNTIKVKYMLFLLSLVSITFHIFCMDLKMTCLCFVFFNKTVWQCKHNNRDLKWNYLRREGVSVSKSSSQTGTQKRENKKNNVNKSHSERNKYLKVHDVCSFYFRRERSSSTATFLTSSRNSLFIQMWNKITLLCFSFRKNLKKTFDIC